MWLWSRSWHPDLHELLHFHKVLSKSKLTFKSFGPDKFRPCVYFDIGYTMYIWLSQGYDKPLCQGQQICEILSRSHKRVNSLSSNKMARRSGRGSGLDCGSYDPGLIPGIPAPCVGPLMARRKKTSRCPCLVRLGMLKTPSCPWRWVPGSRSKFGNWTTVPSLYSWNIAECDIKPQPTNQPSNKMWRDGETEWWFLYPPTFFQHLKCW